MEPEPLRVLILAKTAPDAASIHLAIRTTGLVFIERQADGREAFSHALTEFQPDIVLADNDFPGFDGLTLLATMQHDHPNVPVIMITQAPEDSPTTNLFRAGARDCVSLDQLGPAVRQTLALKNEDGVHTMADGALHAASAQVKLFRTLLDRTNDGIEVIDPTTLRFLDVNDSECRTLGYRREEFLDLGILDIDPTLNEDNKNEIMTKVLRSGGARFETIHRRKDASEFPVEVNVTVVELDRPYLISIVRDITERKQAEAEALRLNRVLWMLSEGNRLLLRADVEVNLMDEMCHLITTVGGYPLAWIGLALHDDYKSISPLAISGEGRGYVDSLRLSWDDVPPRHGAAGEAIRTGQTQVVQDIENDPRLIPWRELARKHGYASLTCLPLADQGVIFGVLNIYSTESAAFSASEIELLEELSEDLAFGISSLRTRDERDQAVRERQHYTEQLRTSMEDAIQTISTVVEMRDPYTAGHQRRVADLAAAIGREMGLPEEQVHGIHLAGTVHDIGKIRIPAEILSKPGHLSEIEMSLVRLHSQAGYDILKGINFPWPIAQAVLQHHERWNGTGYPQGLQGEATLVEARILAVADVVESMSSHRPYRPGLGVKTALEEISRNCAVLYDPAVVAACNRLFLDRRYELQTL